MEIEGRGGRGVCVRHEGAKVVAFTGDGNKRDEYGRWLTGRTSTALAMTHVGMAIVL